MRKLLKDIVDYLCNKSVFISSISAIILSIISISSLNTWTLKIGADIWNIGCYFYIVVIAVAIIFGILAIDTSKELNKLESQNATQGEKIRDLESKLSEIVSETNELFNSYLKLIIKNLEFTHNERISVYKVYENYFKLLGRSSHNPRLAKIGRKEYPIDQGFIAKGWACVRKGKLTLMHILKQYLK